jgi:hypothetical protein
LGLRLLPLFLIPLTTAIARGGAPHVNVPEPSPVAFLLIGFGLMAAAKFRPFAKRNSADPQKTDRRESVR